MTTGMWLDRIHSSSYLFDGSIMQQVLGEVLTIVRRHQPPAAVDKSSNADDELAGLGIGSLELVGLILDVEQTFSIAYPAELMDGSTFRTARSIAESVVRLRPEATP